MKKVKAIVFDVDGTLYNQNIFRVFLILDLLKHFISSPKKTLAALKVLRTYRKVHEEIRKDVNATDLYNIQIKKTADLHKIHFDDANKIMEDWFHTKPLKHFAYTKRKKLIETFKWFKENHIKTALLSDYPCENKAKALGILEYVDEIKSSMDVDIDKLKPDVKGFLRVAEILNLNPGEIIYVGDRYKIDIIGAKKAGYIPVLIGAKKEDKDAFYIKSLPELKEIVKELNS